MIELLLSPAGQWALFVIFFLCLAFGAKKIFLSRTKKRSLTALMWLEFKQLTKRELNLGTVDVVLSLLVVFLCVALAAINKLEIAIALFAGKEASEFPVQIVLVIVAAVFLGSLSLLALHESTMSSKRKSGR